MRVSGPSAVIVFGVLTVAVACKLGGPAGDPDAYLEFPSDAEAEAEVRLPGDDDAAAPEAGSAETAGADSEAGAEPEAGDGGDDRGAPPGSGGVCATVIPVCDPVTNAGCDPLHQCDIDTSQKAPTGVCIFLRPADGGSGDGGACTATVLTESCSPTFTCVAGRCRHPCHCDSDCAASETCSEATGPGGFTLCKAP